MRRYVRTFSLTTALALSGSIAANPASSEIPASAQACPIEAASIYFPEGQSEPVADAREFISRVGEIASECSVKNLVLVAPVTGHESTGDLELILARLGRVSDELQHTGVDVAQIKMSARQDKALEASSSPPVIEIQLVPTALPVIGGRLDFSSSELLAN